MTSIPPTTRIVSVQYGFMAVPGRQLTVDLGFLDWLTTEILDDPRWNTYRADIRFDLTTRLSPRTDAERIARYPSTIKDCLTTGHTIFLMTRAEAGLRGSPLSLVVTWDGPERGQRIAMTGLEQPHTTKDVSAARQALRLFRELDLRGRKPLEQDSWSVWREQAQQAEALKQKYPTLTYEQIAARQGVPYSTLRRWLARWRKEQQARQPE